MTPSPFNDLVAAFTAFLIAVGPTAAGVTVAVDFVRSITARLGNGPGWVWMALSVVFGIGATLLFQLNFVAPVVAAIPALAGQAPHLLGTWGQVLTGFGVAGMSGYWHDMRAVRSAKAAESRATATAALPPRG